MARRRTRKPVKPRHKRYVPNWFSGRSLAAAIFWLIVLLATGFLRM